MKKQNLAILKLVIALVVVYVVYRVTMYSVDGFQTYWAELKLKTVEDKKEDKDIACSNTAEGIQNSFRILSFNPTTQVTTTYCFSKGNKYENLNIPQEKCTMMTGANVMAKTYTTDKVGKDNKFHKHIKPKSALYDIPKGECIVKSLVVK